MKKARELRKMTQQALCDALNAAGMNVSFRTIQNWESGFTEPRWSDAQILSDVLTPYLPLEKEVQNGEPGKSSSPPK